MVFLFHRPEFIAFFCLILAAHWLAPHRFRSPLLLVASYGFYAAWDWRFLGCLVFSTLVDYGCGLGISRSERPGPRRALLWVSLVANLGLLGFFKYFGFFVAGLNSLAGAFGLNLDVPTLHVIVPLGISFYTFQTMSYTIDVYRRRLEATTSLVDFALFVSYFPQLIAGPIEKARDLLPQIIGNRFWSDVRVREGLFLFAHGWALKVVLADPAGRVVDAVFATDHASGGTVAIALYAFALQIYGDFAGYSKMARGASALLGIRLSRNFNLPFFANGYVDFYRRWHITLSSWIGEYVYLPLYYGLPRSRLLRGIRSTTTRMWLSAAVALFVTRMAFAMWHGAAVNFLLLGLVIYFAQMGTVALRPLGRMLPSGPIGGRVARAGQILVTVHLFCFAMLFFRGRGIVQIRNFLASMWSGWGGWDASLIQHGPYLAVAFVVFAAHETMQYVRNDEYWLTRQRFAVNVAYFMALYFLYRQGSGIGEQQFVYFQF